ncbi:MULTISPECIES: D-alanine--D-alanine ligase family protein [Hyphomicrobiales]|jgi:D-alanine-D-alanine ligase|uniref:D-alanine--D-alanine ligase n=1 Tax=Agrobacterium pusense TaxID=648995 RepID=A0AA44EJH9_9HYPH|nr:MULTISPECIES: D-alanine--D-alanine ligase family protein [Hyphomicrobiales]HED1836799.1 D-alanine--D-alanine ligase [Citrobacter freundii]KAB2758305.1 D-alanine--D-alanine ligase [Brucella anthropi]MCQ9147136.1 D-alanine--D-alanine ligase [Ochrobactrum sp. BTU2]MDH2092398.1 D-alanine--D-alanine ligase [Agrobacterium pusense]NRF09651.1 D-alanine--D-alanine ligase [Agrobacterium pusense]
MEEISQKLRIAVLFGGRSAEHDVSVLSATNVMNALSLEKYDPVPVFVTHDGQWLLSTFENGALAKPSSGTQLTLMPGGRGRAIAFPKDGTPHELPKIDVLFPVLHGLHGEDGAVQGMAEVARIPLAGCGITGSANALDKDLAKRLFKEAGVPTAHSITISYGNIPTFCELENALGLPIFIKPARQGSSVGVSKISSNKDYEAAISEGFRHDSKLLAEEFIRGREIECAVLEDIDGTLFVSRTGEIAPAEGHGFYTYDAKYVDSDGAVLNVPADLPQDVEDEIRAFAAKAFRALGCDGMARADFFLTSDMRILVNELNTIPGFTDISMYSKVMAASGISYPEIIDRLVAHGMTRARQSSCNSFCDAPRS